jgi:hypothetical protein
MQTVLFKARQKELLPSRVHLCSHEFCQPENGVNLFKRGLLPESNYPEDLFLCKYGQFHQCSLSDCMDNGYCPISGMSDGLIYDCRDYIRSNPKTFIVKPEPISVKRTNDDKIEALVETILYSEFRKKINDMWWKKQMKLCKKEKDAHVEETRPINLIMAAMIESTYRSQKPPLVILEFNQAKVRYYTQVILQMYEHVQKLLGGDDRIQQDAIALGTLYKMQQGIRVDDTVILPVDRFLVDHLPLINDLPQFKLDKRKFTRGEKLISQMIDNAKKKQIPLNEIAIHIQKDEEMMVFQPTALN